MKWKVSENEITISSPINNKTLGTVPAMTPGREVDYAHGERSCSASGNLSAVERAAYLHKVADILERDQEKIG